MSSSNESPGCRWWGRQAVLAATGLGLALLSAGCGFQPLYGPHAATATGETLSTVRIALIEDRLGQQLRNELLDRVTPNGEPADPRYLLEVDVKESRQEVALRRDETATRANLIMTAQFALSDMRANERVMAGRSRAISSYNILQSDFATLVSERDARHRAVVILADDIATRLALRLNGDDGS